jgi:hypothetical protein
MVAMLSVPRLDINTIAHVFVEFWLCLGFKQAFYVDLE